MESFILFYEKCRLCLERAGVSNIFEKEDFPQDIYLCTGVKIHPSDNLPQKICAMCSNIVKSAKELRNLANINNAHLRSLFDCETAKEINLSGSNSSNCSTIVIGQEENQSGSTDTSNISQKKIYVRKDLFESSATVSSSTKRKSIKEDDETKYKRIKVEDKTFLKCDTCDKTFDKWKKLYCHLRSHNKSVVCPLDACGKKFATKTDLEKHFRTHTGEKPYECSICDRRFSQRVTLKVHRQTVHSQENT